MTQKNLITSERIRELVVYNPESGRCFWKIKTPSGGTRQPGRELKGSPDKDGYLKATVDQRDYRLHRIIWLWMTGDWPKRLIDHKDRNPANNRWDNLREADLTQNNGNMVKHRDNTSGYKGVVWCPKVKKWRSQMSQKKEGGGMKTVYFGYSDDPAEAHEFYKKGASAYFGEFFRAS